MALPTDGGCAQILAETGDPTSDELDLALHNQLTRSLRTAYLRQTQVAPE